MLHVPAGETVRTVCPFCGGGRTRERSFVATNDGVQTKYICHRGTCGKTGVWDSSTAGTGMPTGTQLALPSRKVAAPWPALKAPTEQELSDYAAKYNMAPLDMARLRPQKCVYHLGEERWWYPVFGPHGSEHGGIGRSFTNAPKSLTHIEEGYKLGSWYVKDGAETVALVEDQVSAARMAQHVTTVALLGCHLNADLLTLLIRHTKHLKIALDYDALDKAVALAAKVSPYFRTTQVLSLPCDIKNMTKEQLDAYVQASL